MKEDAPNFTEGELFTGRDQDDILAMEKAYSIFPLIKIIPTINGDPLIMMLDEISLEEMNNYGWWKATGKYKHDVNSGFGGQGGGGQDPDDNVLPQLRINFTIGRSTRHIKRSLGQPLNSAIERDDHPFSPPDLDGAIGVTKDGIEGYDVPNDSLNIQITAYYKPSFINVDFIRTIKSLVGKVNFEQFLGQDSYEVLFLGASGGGAVLDIVPVTFEFSVKDNVNREDPGFPQLKCGGHDVVDYIFTPDLQVDQAFPIQRAAYRYIHVVAPATSFAGFGFGITGPYNGGDVY